MRCAVFARVWRAWLWNDFSGCHNRVVRVTGWRSCLYDTPSGDRCRVTFLGWPWQGERRPTQVERVR